MQKKINLFLKFIGIILIVLAIYILVIAQSWEAGMHNPIRLTSKSDLSQYVHKWVQLAKGTTLKYQGDVYIFDFKSKHNSASVECSYYKLLLNNKEVPIAVTDYFDVYDGRVEYYVENTKLNVFGNYPNKVEYDKGKMSGYILRGRYAQMNHESNKYIWFFIAGIILIYVPSTFGKGKKE